MNFHIKFTFNIFTLLALLASLLGSAVTVTPVRAATIQIDINGPSGSGQFGDSVTTLPNGNFVVTDPYYDDIGRRTVVDVGAVYLYNGATHALISTLTGSRADDRVGSGRVTVLANGNYVVASPLWDKSQLLSAVTNVGAVTFGDATTGIAGTVSAFNSLVGSTANDQVGGYGGVIALTNGNYVVKSPSWDGVAMDVGAVSWGSGVTGIAGTVSSANSLVGSTLNDNVGSVTALTNGNYVVASYLWDGVAADVGAVTWGNGMGGTTGIVSALNSLTGSTLNDNVGNVTVLKNGNYVVASPGWDGAATDVGAVTWGDGTAGTTGTVSSSNSLVGSTANDFIGLNNGVTALTNGNYVVASPIWDGAAADIGAVTWGNGIGGTTGVVSALNSLIGSAAGDNVGHGGATALKNGNYVVASPAWDSSVMDAGAVTWGNGTVGTTGVVSPLNSLVGSKASDYVGSDSVWGINHVTALTNGNYVVASYNWDGMSVNVGAVTWGNGMGGTTGAVSAANSLIGVTAYDYVGNVTALTNGNYVVASPSWDGTAMDVGAVTWGNGAGGTTGVVSSSNSMIGSTANDDVGYVTALTNGNFVVESYYWDGIVADVGAVTWGNGMGGTTGVVSALNSLIGSTANDYLDSDVIALTNGNYVVTSPSWDYAATADVGAVTWGNGMGGTIGAVSALNSLVGSTAGDLIGLHTMALTNGNYVVESPYWDGSAMDAGAVTLGQNLGTPTTVGLITAANSVLGKTASGGAGFGAYDYVNDQLVVLHGGDNIVTLFSITLPSVTSSVRFNPNPTSLASVDFTVTFSEPVTGVDTSDFNLTTTGVSGATVSGVSGSGSVYTVTVNTGSGNGTLRLNVPVSATITDLVGNPLNGLPYTSGEIYTVIKSATFADVPLTYWANGYIERLYNAGITGGCSTVPLNYCPDNTVTRAQMAVFLLKGMHGSSYSPPAVGASTGFTDVAVDYWAAAWIKQLAAESITGGCGAGIYCPDATVTRAQMAVFLLKAKHGSSYLPPAPSGVFTDVPVGYWADKWIEQLAAEAITSGCGVGIYCPDADVTRAQMAVFLVKTFNLP